PFLSVFLTVSNHPPFIVPDEFKDKGNDDSEAIVAYADDCIRVFMESARRESWYENTLFVFIGDHGSVHGEQTYPMALSYNHIPLVFHSSRFDDVPQIFNQYGLQINVYPSMMELLGYSYVNNSLGESLFSHKRPFSYFVSDTHMGCINEELFYLFNPDSGEEGLYQYKEKSTKNLITLYPDIAKEMKKYGTSMLIAADYISSKGWNRSENP
ncbi:MAG: sulfatase-like hydrolase/transferase, partial [Bacteroides sp.]|nr:sulfatase-like hydrolase/transferase [Bacteroides sp.]